jgi:cyclopropane-fatty-acyl-phospholipid synthase
MLLDHVLRRLIRRGNLTLFDAKGREYRYQGPDLPGIPPVAIRLHDPRLHWSLALNPRLTMGEAYMDGTLTIEIGTLRDFLALGSANIFQFDQRRSPLLPLWRLTRRLHQYNPIGRSRKNVAHHYDLPASLYSCFLDADRQYSCAYFPTPNTALDEAQEAKKRHIAAKLRLASGQRVLDIGCGWGGMALSLARLADVEVLGITLSTEQLDIARRRAAEAGLDHRVRFELRDYRHLDGTFDRIVSVGMFEHVGVGHYHDYFDTVRRLLSPDGVALIHSIGRADGPGTTNAWIRKYIFPGGYIPALSEVLPAVEASGLWATDIEILRLHYAMTLQEWWRRFQARREEIANSQGTRFCRMWEFYLAGAEMAFREQHQMVFQIQLSPSIDAVPLTRDYMVEDERRMTRLTPLAIPEEAGAEKELVTG